jgi:hypothetical protein
VTPEQERDFRRFVSEWSAALLRRLLPGAVRVELATALGVQLG